MTKGTCDQSNCFGDAEWYAQRWNRSYHWNCSYHGRLTPYDLKKYWLRTDIVREMLYYALKCSVYNPSLSKKRNLSLIFLTAYRFSSQNCTIDEYLCCFFYSFIEIVRAWRYYGVDVWHRGWRYFQSTRHDLGIFLCQHVRTWLGKMKTNVWRYFLWLRTIER